MTDQNPNNPMGPQGPQQPMSAPTQPQMQPGPVQQMPVQQPVAAPVQQMPAAGVRQAPLQQQPMQAPVQQMYQQNMRPVQQMPQIQQQPMQRMQQQAPGMRPLMPSPTPNMRPGQPVPQGTRPGQPQSARRPPSTRRLLYWVVGCFGCSILLFVIFVLLFVSQTTATGGNALAQSLGVDTGTFIDTLITLVNVIFGFFSIVLFIIAIVGIFRAVMARKDDKVTRKGGLTLAGASGLLLIFLIFIWVGIYLFMSSKKVIAPKAAGQQATIVTDPAVTLGLTAPVDIKFDGSQLPIDTTKYQIISYAWDFGDGQSSSVQIPTHTYTGLGKNAGRYDVKVNVDVKDQTTGTESIQTYTDIVTIANVKLNASFTATPATGPAPLSVHFDASASSAPAGQIQAYDWDFNNANLFKDASGVTTDYTFSQVGTYTVQLRVTDNTGQYTVVTKDITVQGPNLPTASIKIPTTDGNYYVGQQYTFDGSGSTSPNGKVTTYSWDFGDQTPKASTRTATHTYKSAGNYVVSLNVTDEKGSQGQSTQQITLQNPVGAPIAAFTTVPPEAKAGDGFISGTVPFTVNFDASSSAETNGQIVDYQWDFLGDGNIEDHGQKVQYVYKTPGTYNATLTVVDASNKTSQATFVVKVQQQGLQAKITATPVDGVVPLTVVFDASGSSYPGGQIVSYEWDFGDGTPKQINVSKVTYKYTQIGTFNATVTAIASDNSRSTATIPINVRPVPLKACFTATPTQGAAPLTVQFDPACSTGSVASYSWDFGDGQTAQTRKPTHTFANPGSYQVNLQVADNNNVIDTFTLNILVTGTVGQ